MGRWWKHFCLSSSVGKHLLNYKTGSKLRLIGGALVNGSVCSWQALHCQQKTLCAKAQACQMMTEKCLSITAGERKSKVSLIQEEGNLCGLRNTFAKALSRLSCVLTHLWLVYATANVMAQHVLRTLMHLRSLLKKYHVLVWIRIHEFHHLYYQNNILVSFWYLW